MQHFHSIMFQDLKSPFKLLLELCSWTPESLWGPWGFAPCLEDRSHGAGWSPSCLALAGQPGVQMWLNPISLALACPGLCCFPWRCCWGPQLKPSYSLWVCLGHRQPQEAGSLPYAQGGMEVFWSLKTTVFIEAYTILWNIT